MALLINSHGDPIIFEVAKSKKAHFSGGICKTAIKGGAKVKATEVGLLEVRLAHNDEFEIISIDVPHKYMDERIAEIKEAGDGSGTTIASENIRIGW